MSIRPVDFQVLIPKTVEVSKFTSDDANKNNALHQQQAASSQQATDHSLRQVYSQNNPHEVMISEKQKENQQKGKKKQNRRDTEEDTEKKDLNKTLQTSTIDIKI